MKPMLIETGNRVFELRVTPGDEVPGVCRRTLSAELLSGPPLSEAEAARVTREVVADAVARGLDMVSWGAR